MTMATTDRPVRAADMGRQEAEEVTQAIKDNFDSLGAMLAQARDRKAYKALGYRSFESYCQTEFGKSISSAYQLIEDAKILSQLEAKISESYGEEVTLKFPASHLRPLKDIADIDDKLKAIEYAQKLAAAENRKATKKDLEIAVFKVSGKRSENFKNAIESLGFTKGTPVEVQNPLKKDRGVVTHVDKSGKIYVELYYHSSRAMPFNPEELRILSDNEKPAKPLEGSIASKGDRVLIYAAGLEGQQGTIYTWREGKQALVMVDGQNSPTVIAYAEMELGKPKQENTNWESELVWESGKNTYYYFPAEDKIYSNRWPVGLTLEPYTHSGSPIEFMQHWETNFATKVLESLATPAQLKTLALTQAIELPEDEGKEFAADLIASLNQLFPQDSKPPKAMGISFSRTINELISGNKTQTRRAWQDDYAKNFIRYFDENIAIPALDKGRHRGGHELGFIKLTKRPYQQYLSEMSATDLQEEGGMVSTVQEFIDTFFEGQDKLVWVLHFEFMSTPNTEALIEENQRLREQLAEAEAAIQAIVNVASTASPLASPEITEFSVENTAPTASPLASPEITEFSVENTAPTTSPLAPPEITEFSIENAAEISRPGDTATPADFLLENAAEISRPGDTATPAEFLLENTSDNSLEAAHTELPPEISNRIVSERQKLLDRIEKYEQAKAQASKKEIRNIEKQVEVLNSSLADLEKLEDFRVGQTVCHQNRPMILGKITGFDFSTGGMPTVWLKYFKDGELKETTDQELVGMIFQVNT